MLTGHFQLRALLIRENLSIHINNSYLFMINSLVRQWDPIGGVSMFYS